MSNLPSEEGTQHRMTQACEEARSSTEAGRGVGAPSGADAEEPRLLRTAVTGEIVYGT
jgi:hypothetical protein